MDAAVVLPRLDTLYVVRPDGPARPYPWEGPGAELPRALLEELAQLDRAVPIDAGGRELAGRLSSSMRRPIGRLSPTDWRRAARSLPAIAAEVERRWILDRARVELQAAFRAPSELLASLAREEERIERTVGREERAAEAFVAVPGTSLATHAETWQRARALLAAEHAALVDRLENEARKVAPNLSAVVGGRTAARLIASAGGLSALARMPSARLQLLGARRRPSGGRGPRFGILYLAERADEVPLDRRGAFARSVAALAVIAARSDAWTHRDLARQLIRRRDARLLQLRRGRA